MTAPEKSLTWPSRLAETAPEIGEPFAGGANLPIRLDDPGVAWYIEEGALDVFLFEHRDGVAASKSKHMIRAGPGRLVFGIGHRNQPLAAIAKGVPGTRLYRLKLEELWQRDAGEELSGQVDWWVSEFATSVAEQIELYFRPTMLIEPEMAGETLEAESGCILSTRPGVLLWVSAEDGSSAYLGTEETVPDGTGLVPVTSDTWATFSRATRVQGVFSADLQREGKLLQALDEFHGLALGAEQLNSLLSLADEMNEVTARTTHRRRDEEHARERLFTVLGSRRSRERADAPPLMLALNVIGEHEGIVFRAPPRPASSDGSPTLRSVLTASGIRSRKVRLVPEDRWWLGDSGAMLGFLKEGGQPVALLPAKRGRYRVVDPVSGKSASVDAARAQDIASEAWMFYAPLPENSPASVKHLIRLAAVGVKTDLGLFILAGLLASLLVQVPAIAVGILADRVLPVAAGGMLVQVIIALAAFAAVGVLLQIFQGTAMMRLEGRGATRLAAASWDRLLRLPSNFFRNYTAGDIAVRMVVFQVIRDQISGVVANALLSLVFLLPTMAILFVYDAALALVSLTIALFALAFTAVIGVLQLAPQRRRYEVSRRLTGELFQFINGMSKLRATGSEASAFAAWARNYREQHVHGIAVSRLNEHLISFSAALPVLVGAALFAAMLLRNSSEISVGDFLAIYAVSMTFYAAITGLGHSFQVVAALLPSYEQVKPILDAIPESRTEEGDSVQLNRRIRFDRVSFRYTEDGPQIISDVSIHAEPGEFIAIIGESGAGKSTLMRLALGLEDPVSGSIYYDGRDMANLDRRSVRRQIGVVMQDGTLLPGSILDSIIGMGGDLDIEDAWKAARLADVDQDIAEMPMEMFTVVSDNASTFSGGQVQRIRIAAALVRNPSIVFLDEATSWLDARSQAQVMSGIESLSATRIVIAHRLSTIRKAGRIYVLDAGRVVQQGSFDELYAVEGPFRELVQRQMT